GGMGRVFLAMDPRLKRHVALKLLRFSDDPRFAARFLREARAQARVEHPHICKVYEVGAVEGHPYIAMTYIDDPSLQSAQHQMSLEQKIGVMAEVADALHAAHRMGLIHRDIKPANILVERTDAGKWYPYVMDFGLAQDIGQDKTATEKVEGTLL